MTPKDVKALVPVSTTSYMCPVCEKLYTDRVKAEKCTKDCGWATYRTDLAKRNDLKRQANMNYVRLNATSPHDAVQLLVKYAKTVGLDVKFTSYPTRIDDVRNSHGAPIGFPTAWSSYGNKNTLPFYYPGCSGTWVGKIRGKCPKKDCCDRNAPDLRCLFEHVVNGFFTGTGCQGEDFDISGYFFFYDFPKMMAPAGLTKTIREWFPNVNSLNLVDVVSGLSPKLITAATTIPTAKQKPLNLEIRYDIEILDSNDR